MHKRMRRTSVAALVSAVGLSLTVASPMAMSKESMKDDSWVTLSGTITKVDDEGEEFTLDYGSGSIRVEVEDWSWGDRPDRIRQGDRVTVNGRVDDDLFQSKEIDAESVYDEGRGAFYYRSDFGNAKGPRVSYSGAPDQLEDDYWITPWKAVPSMQVKLQTYLSSMQATGQTSILHRLCLTCIRSLRRRAHWMVSIFSW